MIAGHILVSLALIFATKTCEDPFSSTTDMTRYIEPVMNAFDAPIVGVAVEDEGNDNSSPDGGEPISMCSYVGAPFSLELVVDPEMYCWNWEWETDSESANSGNQVSCKNAECGSLTAKGTLFWTVIHLVSLRQSHSKNTTRTHPKCPMAPR